MRLCSNITGGEQGGVVWNHKQYAIVSSYCIISSVQWTHTQWTTRCIDPMNRESIVDVHFAIICTLIHFFVVTSHLDSYIFRTLHSRTPIVNKAECNYVKCVPCIDDNNGIFSFDFFIINIK